MLQLYDSGDVSGSLIGGDGDSEFEEGPEMVALEIGFLVENELIRIVGGDFVGESGAPELDDHLAGKLHLHLD